MGFDFEVHFAPNNMVVHISYSVVGWKHSLAQWNAGTVFQEIFKSIFMHLNLVLCQAWKNHKLFLQPHAIAQKVVGCCVEGIFVFLGDSLVQIAAWSVC